MLCLIQVREKNSLNINIAAAKAHTGQLPSWVAPGHREEDIVPIRLVSWQLTPYGILLQPTRRYTLEAPCPTAPANSWTGLTLIHALFGCITGS